MKKRMAAGVAALVMGLSVASLPVQALSLGNVNGDGAVNASDAAVVLIASAAMGAGRSSGLSGAQLQAADVNGDSVVNASDAAVILIYAAAAGAGSTQTLEEYLRSQGQSGMQSYADAVVYYVNVERQKAGLRPVSVMPSLQNAAQTRANELCTSYSHTRPDGRDPLTALDDAGIRWGHAGENIAYGNLSAEEMVNAWMASKPHKANILQEDFEYIGVGVAEKNGMRYWAQLFAGLLY
ncbi:MAG: hypothetical protein K5695_08950 [Oscillospiraceae bacterium]|nr:hypothetical protein [Oscillospiraceae bacterium]